MLTISVAFTANAQKLKEANVPVAVKAAFTKTYPNNKAKWEKEDGKYEAGFKMNGTTMSALFIANGSMTESEMEIKVADLPATVLAYVKEHHKGKNIKAGAKLQK